MATQVNLSKGAVLKKGYVGFSWTVFFFGFFVPIFRGDWLWALMMFVLQIITFGIAGLIFAFMYNKIYTSKLLEKEGFLPADDYSKQLLASYGMMVV